MEFRIADTFTDSLGRLTADEQKAVKTTAFDLQVNPGNPGHAFHKLDKAKDKHFWSVRVSSDIRLIVHRTDASLLLCYVDHHDKAYQWAERRKLEAHPKTGAAQLVEIRETVQEIVVPRYVDAPEPPPAKAAPKPKLFADTADDLLLRCGVPPEWLADVRAATEDTLLPLAAHLPAEAAEALLELAVGGKPELPQPAAPGADPFAHPDAQRRFRTMSNKDELERALDSPWDKWTIFLHPAQRELVDKNYGGPARVAGSAGTGKTIVALHRAVALARRHPDERVLLTTFSDILANALRARLVRLISKQPKLAEQMEVASIESVGDRLYRAQLSKEPSLVTDQELREYMQQASEEVPSHKFSLPFLLSEWTEIVDAWQLSTWEAYRDVARLGRKKRLPEEQRRVLWSIFAAVNARLADAKLITRAAMFGELATALATRKSPPFAFAVVDEAQDMSIPHLRLLAAIGGNRPNSLFFAGDLGQRIFQQPFSWKALGIEVRGRTRILRVNYRTSHQIRTHADRLLGQEVSDIDGNNESRRGTVSVFDGPSPTVRNFPSVGEEIVGVAKWLSELAIKTTELSEIAVIVRSPDQIERAVAALAQAKLPFQVLDQRLVAEPGHVVLCTMHLAKGLEFRSVAVMACDNEVIPMQSRIEAITDDADLEEVYSTERHLLYVACTRARDHLLVTSASPGSEFLDDLTTSVARNR